MDILLEIFVFVKNVVHVEVIVVGLDEVIAILFVDAAAILLFEVVVVMLVKIVLAVVFKKAKVKKKFCQDFL